ncbi:Required for respiratory growth protein 9 mitochondrial [Schaereria dolodes]|nr:Required for respiratory growth protein 9 mitochondrial [Schaereria dolodes]
MPCAVTSAQCVRNFLSDFLGLEYKRKAIHRHNINVYSKRPLHIKSSLYNQPLGTKTTDSLNIGDHQQSHSNDDVYLPFHSWEGRENLHPSNYKVNSFNAPRYGKSADDASGPFTGVHSNPREVDTLTIEAIKESRLSKEYVTLELTETQLAGDQVRKARNTDMSQSNTYSSLGHEAKIAYLDKQDAKTSSSRMFHIPNRRNGPLKLRSRDDTSTNGHSEQSKLPRMQVQDRKEGTRRSGQMDEKHLPLSSLSASKNRSLALRVKNKSLGSTDTATGLLKVDARSSSWRREREQWQIQKDALINKFGSQGWNPRKRLSPDALEGIRALHAQYPGKYTTPILADQFEVSPEAIRRILKSKWKPDDEEETNRRQRWSRRGVGIWSQMNEIGFKPPKRWREMGVGKYTSHDSFERRPTSSMARNNQQSFSNTTNRLLESTKHAASVTCEGLQTASLSDRII